MDDMSIRPGEVRRYARQLGQTGEAGSDHYRHITPDFLPTSLGHKFADKADAIAQLVAQLHGHGQKLMWAACQQSEHIEKDAAALEELEQQQAAWFVAEGLKNNTRGPQ